MNLATLWNILQTVAAAVPAAYRAVRGLIVNDRPVLTDPLPKSQAEIELDRWRAYEAERKRRSGLPPN